MKAGTTSLHSYLDAHPDVFVSAVKELNFFIANRNWVRGVDWYRSQFSAANEGQAIGEASPNYTKSPAFPGVPELMASVVPDARLIYVVREPVARIRSHFIHSARRGRDGRRFAAAAFDPHYVACSMYSMQLDCYLEHFNRDQILVVTSEALRDQRRATVARVLGHIGSDPAATPANIDQEFHRTEPGVPISTKRRWLRRPAEGRKLANRALEDLEPRLLEQLHDILRPDVARLHAFLGSDFDGWGITL